MYLQLIKCVRAHVGSVLNFAAIYPFTVAFCVNLFVAHISGRVSCDCEPCPDYMETMTCRDRIDRDKAFRDSRGALGIAR